MGDVCHCNMEYVFYIKTCYGIGSVVSFKKIRALARISINREIRKNSFANETFMMCSSLTAALQCVSR